MGANTSARAKVMLLPTSKLVEKMQVSLVPSERDFILDGCDVLRSRAAQRFSRNQACQAIMDLGGIELLLDVLNEWGGDEVVVRAAVRVLTPLATAVGEECEHILELGGRGMVERVKERHSADDEVQAVCRALLKVLLGKGAVVAVKEIRLSIFCVVNHVEFSQASSLMRLGGKNRGQGTNSSGEARRSFDGLGAGGDEKDDDGSHDPSAETRKKEKSQEADFEIIQVVTGHMAQHASELDVQESGCDAFIALGRGAHVGAMLKSNGIELVVKAMNRFNKEFQLQWKGCVAIAHMAERSEGLASELGKKAAISALVATFWQFPDEVPLQQQVLWALGAMMIHDVNIERMKNAEVFRIVWHIFSQPQPSPRERGAAPLRGRDDELFLTVPLELGRVWTRAELKELSKKPPPAPVETKKKTEWKMRAKPKFGRAGDDHAGGSGLV